jgi:hypothetical protein
VSSSSRLTCPRLAFADVANFRITNILNLPT